MSGLNLLPEITIALTAITPDDIESARCSLTPLQPGEISIALIEDEEAQQLWALAHNYERLHALAVHSARFDARTNQERLEVMALADRMEALEEIVRLMAWRRVEDVAGYPRVETSHSLGLRENFILVSSPDSISQQVVGTGISVPWEVLTSFVQTLRKRRTQDSDDLPKPPKPQ